MPVTRRGNIYDNIDQTNTTGFLFRDDDTAMDPANYAGIDTSEDRFPQLHSQKGNPIVVSQRNGHPKLPIRRLLNSSYEGIDSRLLPYKCLLMRLPRPFLTFTIVFVMI